jgi:hypothetical protein
MFIPTSDTKLNVAVPDSVELKRGVRDVCDKLRKACPLVMEVSGQVV